MEKNRIIVATGNANKLREIQEMLPDTEILGYKQFFDEEIEETGETFYENALIKAKTVSERLKVSVLADDSGLCVKALNGEPGVRSARYAGDGNDEHNIDLLLKNMQGIKNRRASFICCMVYYSANGDILTATGEVKGEITLKRRGKNGFGYDPVFFSDELGKTLGIATASEKNAVSHRSRALRAIIKKIEEYEKGRAR